MNIFPAIDLFDGKAVRLYKGDYNQMTVYSENPIEIARDFENKGAKFIHLVDLEGAKEKLEEFKKKVNSPVYEISAANNVGLEIVVRELKGLVKNTETEVLFEPEMQESHVLINLRKRSHSQLLKKVLTL